MRLISQHCWPQISLLFSCRLTNVLLLLLFTFFFYFLWNGNKGSSLQCYNSLHDLFVQEKNCKVVFLRIINTAWGERNEHNSSRNEHPQTFASSKDISDVTLLLLLNDQTIRSTRKPNGFTKKSGPKPVPKNTCLLALRYQRWPRKQEKNSQPQKKTQGYENVFP